MTYLHVADFKLGMDRRRNRGSGTPGSLWLGKNVHVTRGGDIENAKRFVPTYELPVGTFGAAQLRGQLFVFGSENLVPTMPVGVQYQRLQFGSAAMTRVLDAKPIGSGLYVIAEFDDGGLYHFYNGVRNTEWDTIADANATYGTLAAYLAEKLADDAAVIVLATGDSILITAKVPGTAFTISQSTENGGVDQEGISLTEVNPNVPGASPEAQVYLVEFTGMVEATDKFIITLNDVEYVATPRASATGTSIYINNRRAWSTAANVWRYCKITDYTAWDPAIHSDTSSGAGFLDVGSYLEVDRINAAAAYNTQSAVFSKDSIGIYSLQADAELNLFDQPIKNTGTRSPRSVESYGNSDLFYLDHSGVRSLRARNGTTTPYVSDVGSALDPFIQDYLRTLSGGQISRAVSTIEHTDGRFWLAVGERIFVLSFFPATKISAWSYYEPGFEVSDFVNLDNKVHVRAGDTIYVYGGQDGDEWPTEEDDITELVQTPFLSAKAPATQKVDYGFDCDVSGTWSITIANDPNHDDRTIEVGQVSENTYGEGHVGLPGKAAQWAFNFEHSGGGRATISSYAIHYQDEEAR